MGSIKLTAKATTTHNISNIITIFLIRMPQTPSDTQKGACFQASVSLSITTISSVIMHKSISK
ncbi:MAG: hypothetical protein P8N61_01410, partial [Porticoccaceae bacterium]|nr:hypothetical protein [Porticoccaceae bacterium]